MKAFAELYRQLDETTKTNRKVAAMVDYFRQVDPACGGWAVYILSGRKLSRMLPPSQLRGWASSSAGVPPWLFEESYSNVGDLAETISLLVGSQATQTKGSLADWVDHVEQLGKLPLDQRPQRLHQLWQQLGPDERFLFAKLITGSLRVGVSRQLVTRALSTAFEIPIQQIAHRLMGKFTPTADHYAKLIDPTFVDEDLTRPYPFCLAHAYKETGDDLFEQRRSLTDYFAEWKWDGIRAQLIRRRQETLIWSRGEERIEDRFPELAEAAKQLPDGCVLDGELLAWKHDLPLGFLELQRRINRKAITKKLMQQVPVRFIAFDVLEYAGDDFRSQPFVARRQVLERIFSNLLSNDNDNNNDNDFLLMLSQVVSANDWDELAAIQKEARHRGAEGLMLKSVTSPYEAGRVRGVWWKWKIDPLTIDAVLMYAQRGHGRRSNLYSDYTFGLWDNGNLVPFAKAYSGLTDAEIRLVDRFVRENTQDKFGPVRSVSPKLVMELAFENVQLSKRHKSGVAVRFPRIIRWRQDKHPPDANQLDELKQWVQAHG